VRSWRPADPTLGVEVDRTPSLFAT
jgi:hypothetical protein